MLSQGPPTARQAAVLAWILDNGASASVIDHAGATAMSFAASAGSVPAMELLLAKGADIEVLSQFGRPVHYAAAGGHVCALDWPRFAHKILLHLVYLSPSLSPPFLSNLPPLPPNTHMC